MIKVQLTSKYLFPILFVYALEFLISCYNLLPIMNEALPLKVPLPNYGRFGAARKPNYHIIISCKRLTVLLAAVVFCSFPEKREKIEVKHHPMKESNGYQKALSLFGRKYKSSLLNRIIEKHWRWRENYSASWSNINSRILQYRSDANNCAKNFNEFFFTSQTTVNFISRRKNRI